VREFKVTPIRNGTVIDHIDRGQAINVLRILRISELQESIVSVAMNVPTGDLKKKDIVKIEDRELEDMELDKIALIAPNATINIIRNFNVDVKHKVTVPEELVEVLKCTNNNCIANKEDPVKEPVPHKSILLSRDPIRVKCYYCEREIRDLSKNLL